MMADGTTRVGGVRALADMPGVHATGPPHMGGPVSFLVQLILELAAILVTSSLTTRR